MRTFALGFSASSVFAFALVLSACGSAPTAESGTSDDALESDHHRKDGGATDAGAGTDASTGTDAGAGTGGDASVDAGSGDDGNPTRQPCTGQLGSALSGSFGRLDGHIVAVVLPGGSKTCNGDSTHVHLQVEANGAIYDIAVNVDGGFIDEFEHALVGAPWSEGWHTAQSLDYPTTLGIHNANFAAGNQATIASEVETAVASANHVSIFATTYNHSGAHLVHRQGHSTDGAIFLDPLSANPHVLAFHFSTQTF